MVAGSLALAPRIAPTTPARAAVLGTMAQGAGNLGGAAIGLTATAIALYGVGGIGHGVKNVTARALIHDRVDPGAHGRVFAAYAALRNCAELAALGIGGAPVSVVGARTTLIVAGTVTVAIGGIGYCSMHRPAPRSPRSDRDDRVHPEPQPASAC
jgi:hypothetical protein